MTTTALTAERRIAISGRTLVLRADALRRGQRHLDIETQWLPCAPEPLTAADVRMFQRARATATASIATELGLSPHVSVHYCHTLAPARAFDRHQQLAAGGEFHSKGSTR